MTVSGTPTTHGLLNFADTDIPDLGAGGLGVILAGLDALIGIYKIASVVLGANAATMDFSIIPQNFSHLALVFYARTDRAAQTNDDVGFRFNNDSAANYVYVALDGVNAAASAISVATTRGDAGIVTAASAGVGQMGAGLLLIPRYTETVNKKTAIAIAYGDTEAASGFVQVTGTGWRAAAAAINRVTLLPAFGANFLAGSGATLLGIL